jgi:Right handed beta helix region
MSIRKMTALCAATAFAAIGFASPASAQATRTWVSGVGDDVNPCSRTAPCKTFAGAISKTAAGGEINCLDPGGFGAVTITKSLTIDCHYTEGGALAGGNGIVVNALSTDVITLRGLDIFGVSPPSNGVRILAAAAVHIEDCVIRRFNAANSFGVSIQPSGTTNVFITDSRITQNGSGATGGGILVQPTGTGSARLTMENVYVQTNSGNGLSVNSTGNTGAGIALMIKNSQFTGTSGNGISILAPVGTTGIGGIMSDSVIAANSGSGITADGSTITLRVGNTSITGNGFAGGGASGVLLANSAKVQTYLDNRLDGNALDGAFTAPAIPKK